LATEIRSDGQTKGSEVPIVSRRCVARVGHIDRSFVDPQARTTITQARKKVTLQSDAPTREIAGDPRWRVLMVRYLTISRRKALLCWHL
jgi:hypothetical protein